MAGHRRLWRWTDAWLAAKSAPSATYTAAPQRCLREPRPRKPRQRRHYAHDTIAYVRYRT